MCIDKTYTTNGKQNTVICMLFWRKVSGLLLFPK